MFATGKYLKDKAANARRAATTLRSLADDTSLPIADRGVMVAAAAIVEALATKSAKLGKERKAAEEKYARELKVANQKAIKLVAQIPVTTLIEKVAFVSIHYNRLKVLIEELNQRHTPRDLIRSLDYWVETATSEIAHEIASDFVTKKHDLSASLSGYQNAHTLAILQNDQVSMIAKRYEQLTQPATESV